MLSVRRRGARHYVIKFVSECGRSAVFSGTQVSSTNKTDCHDITEIVLKMALNTIKPTKQHYNMTTISRYIPTIETTVNMLIHPYY
jgi:ABC-type proline/glycine betaine transport system ATPase subunit